MSRGKLTLVVHTEEQKVVQYLIKQMDVMLQSKSVYGLAARRQEVYAREFKRYASWASGVSAEFGDEESVVIKVREGLRSCLRWLHFDRHEVLESYDAVILDLCLTKEDTMATEQVVAPVVEMFLAGGIDVLVTLSEDSSEQTRNYIQTNTVLGRLSSELVFNL